MIDARVMRMREIAAKGGHATKTKMLADPDYYRRIGRLGGAPSHVNPQKKKRKRKRKATVKAVAKPVAPMPVEKPMTPLRQAAIEREANRKARERALSAVEGLEA